MDGLTDFEIKALEMQRKEIKKFLRLSSERDLYNLQQAAFRLNVSRNRLQEEYLDKGFLKMVHFRGQYWIPKSEIDRMIEMSEKFIEEKAEQFYQDAINREARKKLR
jgi:predicted site-specific integrase-resolvase